MVRKSNAENGEETKPPLNSTARKAILKNACRELDDLDGQIAVLQDRRNNVKQGLIKGDLNMKISDFNILRRFAKLEADDRDELFDTLKEGFKALGLNQQASFIDALEGSGDKAESEGAEA